MFPTVAASFDYSINSQGGYLDDSFSTFRDEAC